MSSRPYLIISDCQIPYENQKALSFCAYLKRHYGVPDDHVLNVGDEVDNLHGGMYPKDPNNPHSATEEIKIARMKIQEWARYFPQMKLCVSNHGIRWMKKASAAEIPEQLLRSYQEVLHMPEGWKWQEEWVFKIKHPFRMIHGMGYSGMNGHRMAAIDAGMSTAIGHLHSHACIAIIKTERMKIWGMNTGCLIDPPAIAFKYGRDSRFKPCLGAGLVFNEGSTPIWIPLE